ncbi:MAG: CDP-diacylglycerol--glycerol-3-phosphate 3-phosphatidyltransferase [Gaiellaceae bacterium]|jgi:CDP-diacylglycerol--glycerol-3-phosphate 3-phosphatidyltransferase
MTEHALRRSQAHIPNALTLFRIVLIPFFVVLVLRSDRGWTVAGAILFGTAGITDQIDGWLARRWRVESRFGQLVDPLADRLMIDSAVVLLWHAGRLPLLALAVILGRDVLLLGGYKFVMERGYDFKVNQIGKAGTWLLYAGVGFILLTRHGSEWPLYIFWSGLALALLAGLLYIGRALKVVLAR